MGRMGIRQRNEAGTIGRDALDGPVRQRIIGFTRQAERVIQEALGPYLTRAFNGDRSAYGIDPLVEGSEDQGIATINEIIIDGHY